MAIFSNPCVWLLRPLFFEMNEGMQNRGKKKKQRNFFLERRQKLCWIFIRQ
jgi:hypothetical protein